MLGCWRTSCGLGSADGHCAKQQSRFDPHSARARRPAGYGIINMAIDKDGLISPPFNFNHADVAKFSPEVTGRIAINSMCERLGWPSLKGKRLLDFGCGVRFAATIINLEMEIDLYAGVDTQAAPISWLLQ